MDNRSLPIRQAAAGDQEAFAVITARMAPLIHAQVQTFRCVGAEDEDLAQEALLGLLAAVRSYQSERGASFTTYATTCIRRRLISVVRRCAPRADYERPLEDDLELADDTGDPALQLQEQETLDRLLSQLRQRLTPMEYQVLRLRLSDISYQEIAARLAVTKKSVDNTVQRIRRKLAGPH